MKPGGFNKIVIIGLGLIGSSVARALAAADDAPTLIGIDIDPENISLGLREGFIAEGVTVVSESDSTIIKYFAGPDAVDLVIIATPSRVAVKWLSALGEAGYKGVVTDVASTKSALIAAADSLLDGEARYVGGHPMTGSEKTGAAAGRADLFKGAYWLLTPAHSTDADEYTRVYALVSAMGAYPIAVSPPEHDRAVAVISHLPHLAASALVDVAAAHAENNKDLLRLAAGGFKDTTRVAAGSPDMWTSICLDNAEAIGDALADMRTVLRECEVAIRTRDIDAINVFLAGSARVRQSLPAQWVPANEDLTMLEVPMLDRSGVIAEITLAVTNAGCNIESIEIDHSTEDTARLLIVLSSQGDFSSLTEDLLERGYEPEMRPLEVSKEVVS